MKELKGRETPADGVVTGFGKVNGRLAAVIAYDFEMARTKKVERPWKKHGVMPV
jgi:acetyl-CoA carboxylase carboxyltransferase component